MFGQIVAAFRLFVAVGKYAVVYFKAVIRLFVERRSAYVLDMQLQHLPAEVCHIGGSLPLNDLFIRQRCRRFGRLRVV